MNKFIAWKQNSNQILDSNIEGVKKKTTTDFFRRREKRKKNVSTSDFQIYDPNTFKLDDPHCWLIALCHAHTTLTVSHIKLINLINIVSCPYKTKGLPFHTRTLPLPVYLIYLHIYDETTKRSWARYGAQTNRCRTTRQSKCDYDVVPSTTPPPPFP